MAVLLLLPDCDDAGWLVPMLNAWRESHARVRLVLRPTGRRALERMQQGVCPNLIRNIGANTMKALSIALGALLTAGATVATAQFEARPYPWNDIRNGAGWGENRWQWRDEPPAYYYDRRDNRRYWDSRDWRGLAHECWNWRAGTFELAREGEYQDDLDYGRCRPLRYEYRRYRY